MSAAPAVIHPSIKSIFLLAGSSPACFSLFSIRVLELSLTDRYFCCTWSGRSTLSSLLRLFRSSLFINVAETKCLKPRKVGNVSSLNCCVMQLHFLDDFCVWSERLWPAESSQTSRAVSALLKGTIIYLSCFRATTQTEKYLEGEKDGGLWDGSLLLKADGRMEGLRGREREREISSENEMWC